MSESRIEKLLNRIVNGESIEDFQPLSRSEAYLKAALTNAGTEDLPDPVSRLDALLYETVFSIRDNTSTLIGVIENNINKLTVPVGTVNIPASKFSGQTKLEEVHLPDTLKTIGSQAFNNCSNLKKINIPNSVNSIGDKAFYGCDLLEYDEEYGGFKYIGKCLLVPVSNDITSVTFKDTECLIGPRAFSNCTAITDLVIPENVKVCPYAFNNNRTIKNVTLPDNLEEIGDYTFYWCSSLETVNIPANIKRIGASAFSYSTLAGPVVLPNGIVEIGASAFYGADITSINIPETVKTIGKQALYGCANITGEIEIPDGVIELGDGVFTNCAGITAVKLPKNLTKISNSLFHTCSKLKSVTFPENPSEIGEYAFVNCSVLQNITIPDTVEKIGGSAFNYCTSLKSVTLPKNLKEIGSNAFLKCPLTSITLPDGIEKIGGSAFAQCASLTSITIPEGVSVLAGGLIQNCNKITTVVIKGDIIKHENIGYGTAVANVTFEKTVKIVNNYMNFKSSPNLTVESMVNILNAIVDNTGEETTYTVYFGTTNLAKLTDEQKQIAVDKNINLA